MITPALIAKECETQTYTQVARKYGVTKGVVAGRVRRHRHPLQLCPFRRPTNRTAESLTDRAVLVLMADGRERTSPEIARAIRGNYHHVCRRLRKLEAVGLTVVTLRGHGSIPNIWREVPEA